MKSQRPDPIPVEGSFNEFIKEFGGELVSELIPPGPNLPRNADYLFRENRVVAELKCLEKDLFGTEDRERLQKLMHKWTSRDMIAGPLLLRWSLGRDRLPAECQQDMINLVERTFETAIRSAKKQIESTKDYFELPQARGLLLLANDGNYFLQHHEFFSLTCRLLANRFPNSCIDGFVYFTPNMPTHMPGHKLERVLWIPAYQAEGNKSLSEFVNMLGAKWHRFYQRRIGQEDVPTLFINDRAEGLAAISSMKHINYYRDRYYKRRTR